MRESSLKLILILNKMNNYSAIHMTYCLWIMPTITTMTRKSSSPNLVFNLFTRRGSSPCAKRVVSRSLPSSKYKVTECGVVPGQCSSLANQQGASAVYIKPKCLWASLFCRANPPFFPVLQYEIISHFETKQNLFVCLFRFFSVWL